MSKEIIDGLRQAFLYRGEDVNEGLTKFDLMVLDKLDEMDQWIEGNHRRLVEVVCSAEKCSENKEGFCQKETINLELDREFREGCRRPDTTTYSADCEDCDIPVKIHKPGEW